MELKRLGSFCTLTFWPLLETVWLVNVDVVARRLDAKLYQPPFDVSRTAATLPLLIFVSSDHSVTGLQIV
jgi:hypothetical protein